MNVLSIKVEVNGYHYEIRENGPNSIRVAFTNLDERDFCVATSRAEDIADLVVEAAHDVYKTRKPFDRDMERESYALANVLTKVFPSLQF